MKPTEAAPAYDDLFQGESSRGYAMVDQADAYTPDVEHGHHSDPVEMTGQDHTHCAECDRQRDRRERRESAQRSCALVSKTFILISLFLVVLGIVGVQAWKDVKMSKGHK